MDYNSIIKNYSDEKKDAVVKFTKLNNESMKGNTYHNKALDFFFKLWHEHFPQQKQQKTCRGCRLAVCKFFGNVADFIMSERKAQATVEKPKSPKPKKAKKKRTLTGALSPTGTGN